ncbi:MAG: YdeI/OmpD-associated family protein [Vicinamibacteraceae bacterium]
MAKAKIHYFPDGAALRAWFAEYAATADELHVGYYKRHTGKSSPTWSESVDEALCFGWIDGVRHSVDADRYTNRFTPRRKGSHWSHVNIAKVEALIAATRMTPSGLAAYEARQPAKTGRASYEQRPHAFPPPQEKVFKAHKAAWDWFSSQPPGYRRTAIWFVVSAVKAETQAKRLQRLIELSAEQRRIIGPGSVADAKRPR